MRGRGCICDAERPREEGIRSQVDDTDAPALFGDEEPLGVSRGRGDVEGDRHLIGNELEGDGVARHGFVAVALRGSSSGRGSDRK